MLKQKVRQGGVGKAIPPLCYAKTVVRFVLIDVGQSKTISEPRCVFFHLLTALLGSASSAGYKQKQLRRVAVEI